MHKCIEQQRRTATVKRINNAAKRMMTSTIKISALGQELVTTYPQGIGTTKGLEEREYSVTNQFASGKTREILLNGMIIVHRDNLHHREMLVEVQHNFPFFKMQFEMDGHSSYTNGNRHSLGVDILQGCHNLFFFPEVKGNLYYPPCHRYTVEVVLSLEYLNRIFDHNLDALGTLGYQISHNIPAKCYPRSLPITPALRQALSDVINCPLSGVFRKIYLEAKIVELLALQIDQGGMRPVAEQNTCVSHRDTEKLFYVKELLTQNPQQTYSLHEISELAGLNDFKLKKGFKLLFHTTVFGYLTDIRMEKAKSMIAEGECSIAEVAFNIGYKNPQHFTTAFKRRFGYLPSSLRTLSHAN